MALLLGLVFRRVMFVSVITCEPFHQPAGGIDTVKSYRVPPGPTPRAAARPAVHPAALPMRNAAYASPHPPEARGRVLLR